MLRISADRRKKGESRYEKTNKNFTRCGGCCRNFGGVASAESFPTFPTSGDVKIDKNTEYTSTGNSLKETVTITGDGSSTVSVSDVADHGSTPLKTEHGIIYANDAGKITISDLKALNIQSASEKDTADWVVGLNVRPSGAITIKDVGTVNIGTADHPFGTDFFAIQTIGGNVSMTNVGDVNIYTTEVGISAQHGSGEGDSVVIDANGDVTIHSQTNAVRAMALNNNKTAGVSIHADGKVTLTSDTKSAVWTKDESEPWSGQGKTSITISGNQGVEIQSLDGQNAAVYMTKNHGNASSLTISSANGDVRITGGNGIQTDLTDGSMTGTITGRNVMISSAVTGIAMDNGSSNLTLAVNQNGGQITLTTDADGGNAVNISGKDSSLTLGDGQYKTDVTINGYVNVTGENSNLNFGKDTTTHVDSKYLTGEKSFITTGGTGTVTFGEDAKLDIGNVGADTTLKLIDNEKQLSGFNTDMITSDNVLQKFTIDPESGAIKVETVDSDKAAELLGGSVLTNVALAATGDEKYADVKALVDGDNAEEALDSAAGLAAMANVAHGTYTMNGIFSDAVSGHLMNRQDQDVWAYGFHSKENVNGLSFGADYDAQYNGIAAGADFYRKGGTTAGLALIYADSNVSGSNGFATTKNDADYYGVSLYSRFDRGSYALLGDISYMKGDHDVTQMNKGQIITASPDSDSISVGVKAVKDYAAGENGTLTPYVGLRYLRLSTDDFTASNGLHYEGDDQDLVIVPVGVNYTAVISHGKWSVRPYAGIGYVWTAGDRSADQTVMLGTAADSFSYDTADSGSFIARAGVTTDCGNMSYGIGYSWQKGDSVSNNAWTLSASYHF